MPLVPQKSQRLRTCAGPPPRPRSVPLCSPLCTLLGTSSPRARPAPAQPRPRRARARTRSCAAGVSNFWKDVVDTVLPPPPPPPSKLTRKEKVKKREHAQAESMRKRLVRAGVNLAECGLSNLSDKRLHDFYEKLDESKRRIFVKAPKVAAITAAKLFEEFTRLQLCVPRAAAAAFAAAASPETRALPPSLPPSLCSAKVQLPWGMKRGHTVPASVKLTAVARARRRPCRW